MSLLNIISQLGLDYLPINGLMYAGNLNLAPTLFIDQTACVLYCYYTNTKGSHQNYVFNPANLLSFYPEADIVRLDQSPVFIYHIDADQVYSNSGRSSIFDINIAYDECEILGTYENRFEIRETYENRKRS